MSWGTSGALIAEQVTAASTAVDEQLGQSEGASAELARRDAELVMTALESLVETAREGSTFSVGGHRNDDGSGNAYLSIAHVAP